MPSLNRRDFLAAGASGALLAAAGRSAEAEQKTETAGEEAGLVKPLPQQVAWQDCELGLIYHFDMPVFLPAGWSWDAAYRQTLDPRRYDPKKLDTDQWLEAAKAAGAGYAVLTATHMGGFLQWQSDLYPYGLKQAAWRGGKGDLVADFAASCRKYGVKPAVYVSQRFNAFWQVEKLKVNFGKGDDPEKQAAYIRMCEKMVAELLSRYGDWLEIWFDGGVEPPSRGGPDHLPTVDRLQPNIVFYHSEQRAHHRWAGNENGVTGYPCYATMPDSASMYHGEWPAKQKLLHHGDPAGKVWSPAMADAPLRGAAGRHEWFWRPGDKNALHSLKALVGMYFESVGRNANLILGITPDRDGLVPEPDMRRCKAFGKAIRARLGKPVAETRGNGAELTLALPRPMRVRRVSLMEEIAQGERVREYVVEGLVAGGEWRKLCAGESIGHKRLEEFDPVEVAQVRLRVTRSVATPRIRSLAVYGESS